MFTFLHSEIKEELGPVEKSDENYLIENDPYQSLPIRE